MKRRIAALLCALALCLLTGGCGQAKPAAPRHTDWLTWEELCQTAQPGSAKTCAEQLHRIQRLCTEPGSGEAACSLFCTMAQELDRAQTCAALFYCQYCCDPTDDRLAKSRQADLAAVTVLDLLFQAGSCLLAGPHRQLFMDRLRNPALCARMEGYQAMDAEQRELLEREQTLLGRYESLYARQDTAITCQWQGRTWNRADLLAAMAEDPFCHRYAREEYEQLLYTLEETAGEALAQALLALVQVRNEMARNSGWENYYDMVWETNWHRNYTYEELLAVTAQIRQAFSGMAADWTAEKTRLLSEKTTLPHPGTLLTRLAQEPRTPAGLSLAAKRLLAGNLLLCGGENSPRTAYCAPLYEPRQVLVYTGSTRGLAGTMALVHEMGHAAAACLTPQSALQSLEQGVEVSEWQAQCTELLLLPQLSRWYPQDAAALTRYGLLSMVTDALLYQSLLCQLERQLYTEPAEAETVARQAAQLYAQYYGTRAETWYGWAQVTHLARSPGYVAGYILPGAAACALYLQSLFDAPAAMATYEEILALDPDADFLQALTECGLQTVFTPEPYRAFAALLQGESPAA